LEKYLTTNLPKPKVTKPSGPPKLPSGFVFKTQGSDGRCAYYALCHFRNSNLSVDDYLAKATNFYLSNGIGEDESAAWDFADDGNDPQVLAAFGVTEKGFGSGDQYIVARTSGGSPHFYCVRKIQGDWWVFDSLKAKPEHLGDASAVKKYIGSNKTYA
jgi:hypothetical protein